ncbi:MAG: ribosome maturation protein RimP [Frankiales bacterium]|nr:ribosome maturation protein RimP [Frankiales bacterium]
MTARTPQRQQLIDLLGPVISSQGYDLEDVSVAAAGRRSVIRVIVDGDDGIDLDAVATVARAVSEVLDDEEDGAVFTGPFVLEVSSPGVDRPLSEPRHWRRAAGRLVTTRIGDVEVTGRVGSTDERGVRLLVDEVARDVPWDELGTGRVQVEFARTDPDEVDDTDDIDAIDHPDDDVEALGADLLVDSDDERA